MRGKFITFEGLDGSGKTTQLELTTAWLRGRKLEVVTAREPGTTAAGERLRDVLLATRGPGLAPLTELAMMFAARAQLVAEVVEPALGRGAWVLSDRYVDASEAYQGGGRGLPLATIHQLHRLLCRDLWPDLTLILDMDAATSLERARKRAETAQQGRFEGEDDAFFERVAGAYRALAAREPQRCQLIAADAAPAAIQARIQAVIREQTAEPILHAVE